MQTTKKQSVTFLFLWVLSELEVYFIRLSTQQKKYKFFLPLFFKRYPLFWLFEDLSCDENRGLGAGDYLCVVPETIHNGHPTDKRQRCRLQSAVKI